MDRRGRFIREFVVLSRIFEISIMSFIIITAFGIFDFVLPLFIEEFASSVAIIGLAVSLVYMASILSEVPVGILVDKFGRKIVLLVALLALGVIGGAYFFVGNIYIIMLLELIFGIVSVAFWVPSAVLVRDYSPKKMLGESEGVYLSISQIGWVIGPMIAGLVATRFDIRFNFLIFTGLLFASFAYGYIVLIEQRERRRPAFIRIKALALFKEFYKMHEHALTLFMLSLFVHVWIGVEWVYTQLATQQVFGLSAELIGFILGGMMAAEVLLYFPSGYLMDKIGKKYLILAGFLLLFGASYFTFLSQRIEFAVFMLFLSAGAIGWILPGTEAMLTEIIPANKRGEMTGIFDTSKDIGLVLGPLIGGIMADLTFNIMTPFLLVTVVSVMGIAFGVRFWTKRVA